MNILFYYSSNYSSIALSSLMISFQKQGHSVFLLTQSSEGDLHRDVAGYGVKCLANPIIKKNSFSFYTSHIRFLSKFVNENNIQVVYSHLQQANIVSVFAQKFCKARFIICRHHSDSVYIVENKNAQRFDKVINRLGKEFIAPSGKVYRQMTETEKVSPAKIHLIRYAYDFSSYPKPDETIVDEIRKKYGAALLLVKVARLIPEKRHMILFRVIKKMSDEGCDVRLIVLSEGYLKQDLEKYIQDNRLEERIFLLGHKKNVIDFLSASDCVVHVSASEASNNLVKEAALAEKIVIACRDVGDFDDYLEGGVNSFVISKENAETELCDLLKKIYERKSATGTFGKKLKEKVLNNFSIGKIIPEYDKFHNI